MSHLDPRFEDELVPLYSPEQLTPLPPGQVSAKGKARGNHDSRAPHDRLYCVLSDPFTGEYILPKVRERVGGEYIAVAE